MVAAVLAEDLNGTMNKFLTSFVLLVAALVSTTAFADGAQDFTLYNESKLSIDMLYIDEANKEEWTTDVLGVDTLADGASTLINFENTDECVWDIKIVQTGDGTSWIIPDINLCETTEITFKWDDAAKTVTYVQGKVDDE